MICSLCDNCIYDRCDKKEILEILMYIIIENFNLQVMTLEMILIPEMRLM